MKSNVFCSLLWILSSTFFAITGTTPSSCTYGCPSGYFEWYPGTCYKYLGPTQTSEVGASLACIGGSLLVIDSDDEYTAVISHVPTAVWLGITYSAGLPILGIPAKWSTPTTSTATYFKWSAGQPDFGTFGQNTCAYMDPVNSYKWSAASCLFDSKAVACETACQPFPLPGTCATKPCVNGSCTDGALPFLYTCTCDPGFTGRLCDQDINECASNPCQNKGECVDGFNGYTCKCLSAFSGTNCEIKETTCDLQTVDQQKQRIAMAASQMVGSITLLVAILILIIRCVVVIDFSLARILHMGQEFSLFFAQLFILLFRTRTILDAGALCGADASGNPPRLNQLQCTTVAIFLHYIFLVHFAFLFFEALHNYTLYTYVFVLKPVLTRKFLLAICLLGPLPIVAVTAAIWYNDYTTENTCWLNGHSVNSYFEVLPIIAFSAVGVILSEAAGMIEYAKNRLANEEHRFTAIANATGSIFIIPTSFVAWVCGFEAVYKVNLPLYSFTSIVNIFLAVFLLIFHTFGDEKVRNFLRKIFCGCCCKPKKKTTAGGNVQWKEAKAILDSEKEVEQMEKEKNRGNDKPYEYVFDPRQTEQRGIHNYSRKGSLIEFVEEADRRIRQSNY